MLPTRRIYLVHRWSGLVSAVFIVFFSLTGAVAVYRAEIDRVATAGLTVPASATRASLQDAVDAARTAVPGREPELLWLPARPGDAIIVRFAPGADLIRVFVDPATGRVVGSSSGEYLANVIRQTHLRFYFFGWQGRVVTGLFGLMLLVSAVTGLWLYAPFMKGVWRSGRRWWQLRDDTPQLTWSDCHKLLGITTLFFNTIIGATGAVLGLENLQRFSPALATTLHPGPSRALSTERCAAARPLDRLIEAAQAHVAGLRATLIAFPVGKMRYMTVSGQVPGRLRAEGSTWVTLDPCSGGVLEHFDAREATLTSSLYLWMEPLHFGDWGGWPLKLAYCLLGMTSGALAISGLGVAAMKFSHQRG